MQFVRDIGPLGRPDPTVKRIPAADHQVWMDAVALLEHAHGEADAIRARAKDAFEEERRRGYADGQAQARLEAAELMIENVGRTVDYYSRVEGRVVDLVLQSVRRIVADFDDKERVIAVVKGALSAVRNQNQVTLRVAPDMMDTLKEATNGILASFPGIGYLDLEADSRLSGDACILVTEIGVVEASIEGQVEALSRAFDKILGSRI